MSTNHKSHLPGPTVFASKLRRRIRGLPRRRRRRIVLAAADRMVVVAQAQKKHQQGIRLMKGTVCILFSNQSLETGWCFQAGVELAPPPHLVRPGRRRACGGQPRVGHRHYVAGGRGCWGRRGSHARRLCLLLLKFLKLSKSNVFLMAGAMLPVLLVVRVVGRRILMRGGHLGVGVQVDI